MTPSQFIDKVDIDEEDLPVTSYPCQWKPPRQRKQSNTRISDIHVEKHTFGKQKKIELLPLEEFDPRSQKYRQQFSSIDSSEKVCFSTWDVTYYLYCSFSLAWWLPLAGVFNDVTGRSSSSISTLSMNWDGVMATSACKSADTCVHVADFLYYKNNDPCTKLCVK